MANINIVTITGVDTPADWAEATNVLRRVLPTSEVNVGGSFALPQPTNGTVPATPQPAPMADPTPQPIAAVATPVAGGFTFAGADLTPVAAFALPQQGQPPAPATPAPAGNGRKFNGKATDGRGKVGHKRTMFGDPADCMCQPCVMGRNNPTPPVGDKYARAAAAEQAIYGFVLAERYGTPQPTQQQVPTPQPTQVTPAQVASASQRMDALVGQAMPSVTPATPVTPPQQQVQQQGQARVYPPLPQLAQSLTAVQGEPLVKWHNDIASPQKKDALAKYLRGQATCDILRSVADKKATMYETAQRKVASVTQ